jgi:hypothetical protein
LVVIIPVINTCPNFSVKPLAFCGPARFSSEVAVNSLFPSIRNSKALGCPTSARFIVKSSWKTAVLTFTAGLGLLIPAAIGLNENGPTILSPLPALTVFPAFAFGVFLHLWHAAAVVPMLLFFLWLPGLFFGDGKIP